jgi:hypothetical protein
MTRVSGKTARVFIALISIAAITAALAGGIVVYHQQVNESENGQWEPVTPLAKDDAVPVFLSSPSMSIPLIMLFSPGPSGI